MFCYYVRSLKPPVYFKLPTSIFVALLLCCLCLAQGCTGEQSGERPAVQGSAGAGFMANPDAQGWFGSAEALAGAVARAVSANDRGSLDRFRISREEYLAVVWPEIPVGKIEQWKNHSGFVWSQHAAKSDSGLRKILSRYGGTTLQVQSVALAASAETYPGFKIHLRPELQLKDTPKPDPAPRLMGSIIEKAGRFKIFSYNIEQ